MPICPEWDAQKGVLLTWPHQHSSWRDSLDPINHCYENIVWHISRFQTVHILCYDESLRDSICDRLTRMGISEKQLHFYIIKTNDTWIRDYGPLRLNSPAGLLYVDFQFNAWGGKYSFELDNRATTKLMQHPPFATSNRKTIDFVLEGGAIDVNSLGSLLSTRSCLLNSNRNPMYNQTQIESALIKHLGVRDIIWIDSEALIGDDTDGHIDTMARFCNNDTIVYNDYGSKNNLLHNSLYTSTKCDSKALNLVACPMPENSLSLPASYMNFLIINGAVLVPTYQDIHDQEALTIFKQLFPEREVIGIDCTPLIQQFGSLHCATLQF